MLAQVVGWRGLESRTSDLKRESPAQRSVHAFARPKPDGYPNAAPSVRKISFSEFWLIVGKRAADCAGARRSVILLRHGNCLREVTSEFSDAGFRGPEHSEAVTAAFASGEASEALTRAARRLES